MHPNLLNARQLGQAYEKRLGRERRRQTGRFYTPEPYVQWLVEQALLPVLGACESPAEILALRIADPACGAGYFLIAAGWAVAGALAVKMGAAPDACFAAAQTCLTGVDTDDTALALAASLLPGARLMEADALARDWGYGYDVILGNPPFGGGVGRFNLASRFLLRSLERLRRGGRLGLVLPKSVAHIAAYAPVRALVPSPVAMRDLGRGWREVGLEQIAVVIAPGAPAQPSPLQERLGLWPLYLDGAGWELVERLWRQAAPLGALCRPGGIFRGLPYQSRHDLLTDHLADLPMLAGRHITHYTIREGPYRRLPQAAAPARLLAPKVVAKRLVSSKPRIEAAWDQVGLPNFDTVTNILPGEAAPPSYLTGILNSRLAAFYLTDVLFNRSVLSVDLDRPYLTRVPVVPWKGDSAQREVANLAAHLCGGRAPSPAATAEIDRLVLRIYGVADCEPLVRERTSHLDEDRRKKRPPR